MKLTKEQIEQFRCNHWDGFQWELDELCDLALQALAQDERMSKLEAVAEAAREHGFNNKLAEALRELDFSKENTKKYFLFDSDRENGCKYSTKREGDDDSYKFEIGSFSSIQEAYNAASKYSNEEDHNENHFLELYEGETLFDTEWYCEGFFRASSMCPHCGKDMPHQHFIDKKGNASLSTPPAPASPRETDKGEVCIYCTNDYNPENKYICAEHKGSGQSTHQGREGSPDTIQRYSPRKGLHSDEEVCKNPVGKYVLYEDHMKAIAAALKEKS